MTKIEKVKNILKLLIAILALVFAFSVGAKNVSALSLDGYYIEISWNGTDYVISSEDSLNYFVHDYGDIFISTDVNNLLNKKLYIANYYWSETGSYMPSYINTNNYYRRTTLEKWTMCISPNFKY